MNQSLKIASIVALLITFCAAPVFSQKGKLPPFKMIRPDGSLFRAQDLPMGKPIMIIYFSPECEECQNFTEEMMNSIEDFFKASIAMVTYLPATTLPPFIANYKLNIYPNIFVGTEGNSFFLRAYYNIQRFPFIAVYSKEGNLVKAFNREPGIEDLKKIMKDL